MDYPVSRRGGHMIGEETLAPHNVDALMKVVGHSDEPR